MTFQDWMDGQAQIHEQIMKGLRAQLPVLERIAATLTQQYPRGLSFLLHGEAIELRKTAAILQKTWNRRTWNHEPA